MAGLRSFCFGCLVVILGGAFFWGCSGFRVFGSSEQSQPPTGDGFEPMVQPAPDNKSQALEDIKITLAQKDKTIANLEQEIRRLNQKIKELKDRISRKEPVVYKLEYIEPVQLYRKARNLLLEDDPINASQLFRAFAKHHPQHSLADNALYWLGECHYTLGRYETAVKDFKTLIKTYPKAEKVPDAILKIGYSYLSMDDINRAGYYLKQVLKKHPFSPAAEKAQIKLKSIE